jgi:predicted AAA+ superfamily ATPase
VQWLIDAGLVLQSLCVKKIEHPLTGFTDSSSFKLYSLDIGLLGAMARIPEDMVSKGHTLFQTWHGAFVESYIAQQLTPLLNQKLHYWKSETHQAEIDFIITEDMDVYPLEVKAGINTKSKSLLSYYNRFQPKLLLRTTLLNLKHNGNILNIPLYAIENLLKYIPLGLNTL